MLGQKPCDLGVLSSKAPDCLTPETRMLVEGIERNAVDQTRRRQGRLGELGLAPDGRQPKQGQEQRDRLMCFPQRDGDRLEQPPGNAEPSIGSHYGVKIAGADASFSR